MEWSSKFKLLRALTLRNKSLCTFFLGHPVYKGCNALKGQKMVSNQSGAVGGTILGPFHFRGNWPIWGPLDGSKAKFRAFWGRFQSSLTPPANSVNILWSQMFYTGIPHIVLCISWSTRTRAVRRQKKGAKKGASYRRLRRLLRRLYIVNAVLEASGRQALLLWSFWDATDLCATFGSKVMSILK